MTGGNCFNPWICPKCGRVYAGWVSQCDLCNAKIRAEKSPDAVELGRRGGSAGGKKRAEKLSPERRVEIAKMGAKKRWNK